MSTGHAEHASGKHGPQVFEMQEIASRAEDRDSSRTPLQQAHALLDTLFPPPAHAGNALHGVVPPAFRYDDRWPDAGEMPDLLGQCGTFLGAAPEAGAHKQADADAATTPAVVEGTLDELHQVMPYLF